MELIITRKCKPLRFLGETSFVRLQSSYPLSTLSFSRHASSKKDAVSIGTKISFGLLFQKVWGDNCNSIQNRIAFTADFQCSHNAFQRSFFSTKKARTDSDFLLLITLNNCFSTKRIYLCFAYLDYAYVSAWMAFSTDLSAF